MNKFDNLEHPFFPFRAPFLISILQSLKFPELELFVVFAVMAGVLIVRPEGLFAPPKARTI